MKIEDVYALSPLQKGMYFHWLTSPTSYFEQVSYRLKGRLDLELLEKSYQTLVERHAILRTFFTHKFGEEVLQVVKKEVEPVFSYKDVSSDSKFSFQEFKKEDRNKGFDLSNGSQMRLHVLKVEQDTYEFVWSQHHILMDGWCVSILIKEFFQIYEALRSNRTPSLAPIVPYSKYIKWLEKVDESKSKEYWRNYLSNYSDKVSPPQKRTVGTDFISKETTLELDGEIRKNIANVCSNLGITENIFIQTVWGVLLAKYNRTNDVVFGSVVSGRPAEISGVENMIGLFINTIPVRVQLEKEITARELLKQVMQESVDSTYHHYMQLGDLLEESELRGELFNHLLVFENFPMDENMSTISKDDIVLLDSEIHEHSNYEFTLAIIPRNESIDFRFKYDGAVYDDLMIDTLKDHFKNCIKIIAENPSVIIDELDYLSADEKQKILFDFNDTVSEYPKDKTIVNLFSEQVKKSPNAIALVFKEETITYKELDEKSSQLTNYILSQGVSPNKAVGLYLDRSFEMIISILGVLKANCRYVPLDTNLPEERIKYILQDSEVSSIITNVESFSKNGISDYQIINITKCSYISTSSIFNQNPPSEVAYIMYTSGSTGKPKGISVTHQNIVKLVFDSGTIGLEETDKVLQWSNYAFDGSTYDIFGTLLKGAALHLIEATEISDIFAISKQIKRNQITKLFLTTALFNALVDSGELESLKSIKHILFGGETASIQHVKRALEILGPHKLVHVYGPTETTVFATSYVINSLDSIETSVPIGKPISNTNAYILDENQKVVPIGITGELCISGDAISKGYLSQEKLTAEKFIKNPFVEGKTLYKTGDLARWLPSGDIEFIGRKDNQVKVRGYRIELEDIESALLNEEGVLNVCVLALQDEKSTGKFLVGYVVLENNVNRIDLQNNLLNQLPEYMIPQVWVELKEIPLTSNGKIDRKALPLPDITAGSSHEFVAPKTETENQLASMWKNILNIDKVGIYDNFFELGGHSIKATRLIAEIYKTFKIELKILVIFKTSNLEELAREIDNIIWINSNVDLTDVETEDIVI
ncbi:non-ribosomal peptide synthetase [Tenacibaculum sp.]|uniref:non-ribosomal peptide synthetase n=1 Tax=Tenacibaculum sp. TaxID=1906242 RepID=UPI003D10A83A